MHIDLNADLGEEITDDEGLLALVTSANVACGYHAGNATIMRDVCQLAAEQNVAIGAQVSYLDREGFGRRAMEVSSSELSRWITDQVQQLMAIAEECGTKVSYLKPHGALYNRVVVDAQQAAAVIDASAGLPILGFPGSELLSLASALGLVTGREGFPDRGYDTTGRLIARGEPGAHVQGVERISAHAVGLAPEVDSLCVHGDSPDAVRAASMVRTRLHEAGYRLRPWVAQLSTD